MDGVSSLAGYSPSLQFGPLLRADGSSGDSTTRGLRLLTPSDIGEAIHRRRGKRSAAPDGIPGVVLKRATDYVWWMLAVLLNHCFNVEYFPRTWKSALVIPIPKGGCSLNGVGGYRPISLLSSLGKLMEQFILYRLWDTIEDLRVLKDCQFGFRRGHSTTHALMVLTDYITNGLNRRCSTVAVSLDFSRAFDTVWQDAIIYKILSLGFDRRICR